MLGRIGLGAMQATLFVGGLFPPPATLTLVLPRKGCPRARLAPDTHHSLCVQGVVGDLECTDGIPNLGAGSPGKGVEFDELVAVAPGVCIELDRFDAARLTRNAKVGLKGD